MEKIHDPKHKKYDSYAYANRLPPPEKVRVKRNYTFTLNPNDARQHFDKEDRQELVIHDMARWMANRSTYLDIMVYLEVSLLGRLHWHGVISFEDNEAIRRFYVNDVHALINSNIIEIDTMEDEEYWLETYCTKQEHLMNFVMTSKFAVNYYLHQIQKLKLNPKIFKPIHECA